MSAKEARSRMIQQFRDLTDSTEQQVELLSSLAALRPQYNGKAVARKELLSIDEQVAQIEQRAKEIQSFLASERDALEQLERIDVSSQAQARRLNLNAETMGESPLLPTKAFEAVPTLTTSAAFEAVPTTTRERLSLSECNSFIMSIQEIVAAKQHLLTRPKSQMSSRELKKFAELEKQQELSEDRLFVVDESELEAIHDLSIGRGKRRALLHTLRNLGKLRQIWANGTSVYLISN